MTGLTLISHPLCPYVQRAVIALLEKSVAFERVDIDLADKPDWFKAISPLGRTPVLKVQSAVIFESAVILEYLEETQPRPLHPADPLKRAEHRSWIEFGSSMLQDVWGFYAAPDEAAFKAKAAALASKLRRLEDRVQARPYFSGAAFSLVDVAFGPVFRYFDVFEAIADFDFFGATPKVATWRNSLKARPSVRDAVHPDYQNRLMRFLAGRGSYLSGMMAIRA